MESRQTIIKFLSEKYEDITSGIYSGSSQLIEILDDGEQLDFKGCNANSFEAKIANLTDKLIVGEKISVCQKIGTEEVQLFTGIIDTAELQTDKTYRKVVAYDELYSKAAVNITSWYNNFFTGKSNVTLKNFRDELFAYIGIEQVETTLINDEMIINQTATGIIKFGDMVANICEINGVFGNINRYGKFEYVDLNNSTEIDITDNLRSNGKVQDYEVMQISSVELYTDKESNYYITGSGNSFIVNGNSLLYEKTYSELQEVAENLLAKVKEITYTPIDINTIVTDLNITPGTKITFTTHSGKIISTYVMRNKLSDVQMFKQNIIANGDKTRSETVNNTNSELDVLQKAMIMKLDAFEANLTYAKIVDLDAIDVEVQGKLNANELESKVASFGYMTVDTANLLYASIPELDGVKANIDEVNSKIVNTNTLIFGSASGDTIQTSFSNSVIAQLGDAQIESAMIKEISALKITGLDLNTTKFKVHSEDGLSYWEDNTICMYDGALGTPRIQLGKDGSGDYNMYIWNASGKLMFDALGLTENGISRQIIRDEVVKDDANISAGKLNIESLFGVINDDTSYTLKSSKILLDDEGQTLDVSFKVMSSTIEDLQTTQTSQGTEITTIQGQISSKIWQQDITTAIADIEIGGKNLVTGTSSEWNSCRIGQYLVAIVYLNTSELCEKHGLVDGDTLTYSVYIKSDSGKTLAARWQKYNNQSDRQGVVSKEYIMNGEGISTVQVTIDSSYTELHLLITNVSTDITDTTTEYYRCVKLEKGTKATDWTPAPEDVAANITTLSTQYSSLEQDVGAFKTTVSETYTTITDFNNLQIGGTNLFIISTAESGYIGTDGSTVANDKFYTSDYIKIESNQEYTFSRIEDTTTGSIVDAWRIAWFDENKTFIERAAYTDLIKTLEFVETAKYIRVSAGKLSKIKVEKGNRATDWSPAPEDINIKIDSTTTIATQTADKFNWLVASGTSSSDFTLTDRMAELTAQTISLNGNVLVNGDMLIDGSITADKLATDAITSRNAVWEGDDSGWSLVEGSMLNLEDGTFQSPNLVWDKYGNLVANNAKFVSGSIGEWKINPDTNSLYTHVNYGGDYGTDYEVWMRAPVNNEVVEDFLGQWVFASAYASSSTPDIYYPYFYITTDGSAYFDDVVEVYDLKCTKFLSNWETWDTGGLFTKKLVGTSTAGTNYCFWIEPMRDELGIDTKALYGGYQAANTTDTNSWDDLWYITWDGYALFDTVSATQYNNVSDKNKKHDITNLNEQQCIDVILSLNPVSYKFNNNEYQRNHWGFIAQDVESALDSLNISWQDFAVVDKQLHKTETVSGELSNATDVAETYDYYLRYEAFIAPIVAVEQNHEKRIRDLENDLAVANAIIQSLLIQQSSV